MSLETKIVSLAQAVGTDIKTLINKQGDLTALNTATKTSLVAALNELQTAISSATGIDDESTGTGSTWSSSKISTQITTTVNALIASSPETLDTLKELADALNNDPNFATTIATQIGNRVRVDAAMTLNGTQQTQARSNINAASATDLATLTTNIGNTDRNFVTDYNTAKA